jgi:chromosome segregation ATPase
MPDMPTLDVYGLLSLTGMTLAVILALALVVAVVYLAAIGIQKLRIWMHDLIREAMSARAASITAKARQQDAQNKARIDELQAKQRIAEAEGNLTRFTLTQDAEMSTLKADANAKSKGVLSQLDQRFKALADQQREAEDRHEREKHGLQQQIEAAQHRIDDARRTLDDATAREQQHLATIARLEQEVRSQQEMIADLRSHLTAAETARPLNATLMNMAKSLDDLAKHQTEQTKRTDQQRF